jgi:hypothetical protein
MSALRTSLILLACSVAISAPSLHAEGPPFHQPPQPPEAGAARTWAEKYAERKEQWCFQPVRNPATPPVRDATWPTRPLDQFILARLEAEGLKPSAHAVDEALTRRLSFALTGLPPDASLHGVPFEVQVDRLIASPAFGEHWARHWMDVVRYAETFGSEHDYLNPHAWRYRDYLVRAFNEDVPYDRFIQEQIAGDLLEKPRMNAALGINESLLGTAYQRMSEFYATPVDVMREQSVVIDWQIENLSRAFMGLTISCARCHDHKFDPISTADFYALYGVFSGARPVLNIVDDPATLTRQDPKLRNLKDSIRDALAAKWLNHSINSEALRTILMKVEGSSSLVQLNGTRALSPAAVYPEHALAPEHWHHSGPGMPARPLAAGTLSLQSDGEHMLRAIQPAGYFSDSVSERHGGSLRSPEFVLVKNSVSVLATGTGKARLRLVVEGCQGDIVLFGQSNQDLTSPAPRWITIKLREQWMGRRAHLEVMTRDDMPTVGNVKDVARWEATEDRSAFGILDVVLHDAGRPPASRNFLPAGLMQEVDESWEAYVGRFEAVTRSAITAWQQGQLSDPEANLLQGLLEEGLLPNALEPRTKAGALVKQFRELEKRIPAARRAPGVRDDRTGRDTPVFVRGEYLTPGELVPRRMPEVLGGRSLVHPQGDRYALAMELTRRDNPLTARVMVNRIWHHLFGRGLVGSTDNFGRMGDKPSHPELLDHLATKFMEDGWSVKKLVRYIVTSSTWQTSSEPRPDALAKDPGNLLLSHAHVRRLPAEAIRDAMLSTAGNLNLNQSGASVPFYYRTAVDPDKQPPPGPLDGRGRRSLYLEVRRNFLSDFLTVFDFPRPNNPTGNRSITNVPAQSITLMNDPFVLHEAQMWGRRMEALPATHEQRIIMMYQGAFGRAPSQAELANAMGFLRVRSLEPVALTGAGAGAGDAKAKAANSPWQDLAHALFNMKEFIFIP